MDGLRYHRGRRADKLVADGSVAREKKQLTHKLCCVMQSSSITALVTACSVLRDDT